MLLYVASPGCIYAFCMYVYLLWPFAVAAAAAAYVSLHGRREAYIVDLGAWYMAEDMDARGRECQPNLVVKCT